MTLYSCKICERTCDIDKHGAHYYQGGYICDDCKKGHVDAERAPKDEVPWWLPVLCDEAYFARLRTDYPRNAYMTNAALHEHYNEGRKYSIVWDHIGDAYAEYEPLADAFLTMAALLERIVEAAECHPIDTDAIGEARDLLSRLGRGK